MCIPDPLTEDDAVERFDRPFVTAVLSGFDRLVLRGTLLPLVREGGMFAFLCRAGVRLLDFGDFVRSTSEKVKAASLEQARLLERPVEYLESSRTNVSVRRPVQALQRGPGLASGRLR